MKLRCKQDLGHGAQVAGGRDAGEVNMEHGTWKECCLEDDFPLDMEKNDVNFLGSRMVQVEYMRCNVGAMLYTLYNGAVYAVYANH